MTDDTALREFITARRHGVLATIRRDGRPQLSTITHLYNPETDTVTASITETRAKTKNMRRDPRVTYHVGSEDGWSYVVAEARAELTQPAAAPDDATVEALVDYYRRAAGEHPNWAEYREAMVTDQRVLLTLHLDKVFGVIR
ncbi:PPOX class F420-dependent oxidoreductase [Amycolatopsis sp. WQ 127309]|uniref:PPOX class F420-dependent oxidoreductase n=1 Tax=Amycolatopsis sp. WQ 127309 TaxID=2932773 RepID=UPI001FF32D15|nr:PPOX class F420-dependent oxidoreductase [Amycolatopsis sp. WQ 127309]UOZ08744.1 PPOX class F420-dependent oxidoreductase [Amycolatopsis sp. WQ 127309]